MGRAHHPKPEFATRWADRDLPGSKISEKKTVELGDMLRERAKSPMKCPLEDLRQWMKSNYERVDQRAEKDEVTDMEV